MINGVDVIVLDNRYRSPPGCALFFNCQYQDPEISSSIQIKGRRRWITEPHDQFRRDIDQVEIRSRRSDNRIFIPKGKIMMRWYANANVISL
jgi:hypothetical protein